MAERNGHHLWARAFRYQTAWLFTQVGDFERARALCQRVQDPDHSAQLGQLLGSIVLGLANLGLRRYAPALRAFEEVVARCGTTPIQMDWILQMPLRLGLFEYWLARRAFGRARDEAHELCRLAATAGERTYLALGRRALAECALGERDRGAADREIAEALRLL